VVPPEAAAGGRTRRLVDLLGLPVIGPDGHQLGYLNDVRLAPTGSVAGVFPELVIDGLVVDGKHVGSLLGYDRRAEQGPWPLRRLVRRIHRDAGFLPWEQVQAIDWERGQVRVATSRLQPLDTAARG
jgi:sporulation protein YlmC with PRC-barrel domain